MLTLSNLTPKLKKKNKIRRGRGSSSGHGGFSGRGIKGQKARTGGKIPPGFEGGRMPLIRQMPKMKGFRSPHPKMRIVTLAEIKRAFPDGGVVSAKSLFEKKVIRDKNFPLKIVGKQKLEKSYTIHSLKVSASAKQAIEEASGKIVVKNAATEESNTK